MVSFDAKVTTSSVADDCSVFHSQPGLASTSVVGAFDPDHDLDAKVVSGRPGLAVQDVLLEQREERFHGGVVHG